MDDIVTQVHTTATKLILYLPHAVSQMARPQRRIRRNEVESVVMTGEVIEDYPNDSRGHSCLLLGYGRSGRPIHVVCAPKADYLAIITAYLPDPDLWDDSFRRRK